MNQVWAWLITGLTTGVAAPLSLLSVRHRPWWRPPRLPAFVVAVGFVFVHGVLTISLVLGFHPVEWSLLHVALLAFGVVYWTPIIDPQRRIEGPGRLAYTFLSSPALDLAGVVIMALGHSTGGAAMIVGMVPLNVVAVALLWRWMSEEDRADSLLVAEMHLTSPHWVPPISTSTDDRIPKPRS